MSDQGSYPKASLEFKDFWDAWVRANHERIRKMQERVKPFMHELVDKMFERAGFEVPEYEIKWHPIIDIHSLPKTRKNCCVSVAISFPSTLSLLSRNISARQAANTQLGY